MSGRAGGVAIAVDVAEFDAVAAGDLVGQSRVSFTAGGSLLAALFAGVMQELFEFLAAFFVGDLFVDGSQFGLGGLERFRVVLWPEFGAGLAGRPSFGDGLLQAGQRFGEGLAASAEFLELAHTSGQWRGARGGGVDGREGPRLGAKSIFAEVCRVSDFAEAPFLFRGDLAD